MTNEEINSSLTAIGILGLMGLAIGSCVVYSSVNKNTPKTPKEPIKTEVVGQYKNCDIIRLNIPSDAKYHYTLYCENQK